MRARFGTTSRHVGGLRTGKIDFGGLQFKGELFAAQDLLHLLRKGRGRVVSTACIHWGMHCQHVGYLELLLVAGDERDCLFSHFGRRLRGGRHASDKGPQHKMTVFRMLRETSVYRQHALIVCSKTCSFAGDSVLEVGLFRRCVLTLGRYDVRVHVVTFLL